MTIPETLNKSRWARYRVTRLKRLSDYAVHQSVLDDLAIAIETGGLRYRQMASPEASTQALRVATKKLDQAAAKSVIHANNAARTKSRLSKAIKALKK